MSRDAAHVQVDVTDGAADGTQEQVAPAKSGSFHLRKVASILLSPKKSLARMPSTRQMAEKARRRESKASRKTCCHEECALCTVQISVKCLRANCVCAVGDYPIVFYPTCYPIPILSPICDLLCCMPYSVFCFPCEVAQEDGLGAGCAVFTLAALCSPLVYPIHFASWILCSPCCLHHHCCGDGSSDNSSNYGHILRLETEYDSD